MATLFPASARALAANVANVCLMDRSCDSELVLFAKNLDDGTLWLTYRSQSPEEAMRTLKQFLKSKPHHAIARFRLGEVLWEQDRKTKALEIWQEVPDSALYFADQSAQLAKKGRITEAEKRAEIAQTVDPAVTGGKFPMYRALCQAYRDKKQFDQALHWCELMSEGERMGGPSMPLPTSNTMRDATQTLW